MEKKNLFNPSKHKTESFFPFCHSFIKYDKLNPLNNAPKKIKTKLEFFLNLEFYKQLTAVISPVFFYLLTVG